MDIKSYADFKNEKMNESYEHLEHYMFFSNLETIKRKIELILSKDFNELDAIIDKHDWAADHVSNATENINQVCDFLMGNDFTKPGHTEPAAEPKT